MRFWISPSEPVESAARTINPLQHIWHTLCSAKLIRNERSKLRLECVPSGSSSVQVFQKLLGVSRWNRPARSLTLVPIAQSRERARPKRQVAGESPAGDTNVAGVVQQQNAAVPRPRQRCDSVHPLHFGEGWWERRVLPSLPLACHASALLVSYTPNKNGAGERNRTVVSALAQPHSACK